MYTMYFRCFVIIYPWKMAGPVIKTYLSLHHQERFVPNLVEKGLVVLELKIFKFHQCIFAFS